MNYTSHIHQQMAYGKALAQLYIASQEDVSQEASHMVCDLIVEASNWAKIGFNLEMKKSNYYVRA